MKTLLIFAALECVTVGKVTTCTDSEGIYPPVKCWFNERGAFVCEE